MPFPSISRPESAAISNPKTVREFIRAGAEAVDEALDRLLPRPATEDGGVAAAMRYTVLAPGKRLRPIVCLGVADLFGVPRAKVLPAAAGLEMVHACSLILDDLPCMDDASVRRGLPSNHRAHGEATAILAAFALLNRAYGIIASDAGAVAEGVRAEVGDRLSRALGTGGLIGGQSLDLGAAPNGLSLDRLETIHRLKTGSLFVASVEIGALLGGASEADREALTAYARNLGLAYQIVDDLLDATGSPEKAGKPVGADAKGNFVTLAGVQGARRLAEELTGCAIDHLAGLGERGSLLRGLAREMTARSR
jgi:geranylgeranyl pyrophosphate synthase